MLSSVGSDILTWVLIAVVIVSLGLSLATLILQIRRGSTGRQTPIVKAKEAQQQRQPPTPPQHDIELRYPSPAHRSWQPPAPTGENDSSNDTEALFSSDPKPFATVGDKTEHLLRNEYRIQIKETSPHDERDYEVTVNGELSVGRSKTSGLHISHPTVSGLQCILIAGPDSLFISNKSNSNTTRLNGVKLGDTRSLKPGDTLSLGKVQLSLIGIHRYAER